MLQKNSSHYQILSDSTLEGVCFTHKDVYKLLPQEIRQILILTHGWLTGSAVEKLKNAESIKDYDILVSDPQLYQTAVAQLSSNPKYKMNVNTFGGLKFKHNDFEIDIWPENLEHHIATASHIGYLYNIKLGILLSNVK